MEILAGNFIVGVEGRERVPAGALDATGPRLGDDQLLLLVLDLLPQVFQSLLRLSKGMLLRRWDLPLLGMRLGTVAAAEQ